MAIRTPQSTFRDRILCLDPASVRTGYAVMGGRHGGTGARGREGSHIVEAGYLSAPARLQPIQRIVVLTSEAVRLVGEFNPAVVVIEITSGKVAGRHQGPGGHRGAGMGVYGMAVGAIFQAVRELVSVFPVTENDWTGGVPKGRRRRQIAAEWPQYREQFARDAGGDIADAIGLGVWFFTKGGNVETPRQTVEPQRRRCARREPTSCT